MADNYVKTATIPSKNYDVSFVVVTTGEARDYHLDWLDADNKNLLNIRVGSFKYYAVFKPGQSDKFICGDVSFTHPGEIPDRCKQHKPLTPGDVIKVKVRGNVVTLYIHDEQYMSYELQNLQTNAKTVRVGSVNAKNDLKDYKIEPVGVITDAIDTVKSLSEAQIAAIVIGVIVFVCIIVGVIVLLKRRRSNTTLWQGQPQAWQGQPQWYSPQ